jgi:PAS domain S-box-containing protein
VAEETSRLLASIVQSSDDAIIGHDLNGAITSWNKGAERIFGYSAEEMLGQSPAALAPPAEDEMPDVLGRIQNGVKIDQYYAVRRTKAGRHINVSIAVSPLHDGLGRIVGASKIARDVTGTGSCGRAIITLECRSQTLERESVPIQ